MKTLRSASPQLRASASSPPGTSPPGECIRIVTVIREIIDAEPLRPEDGERQKHCAYPDGRVVLYGFPDRHYNHGYDPNAWERYVGGRAAVINPDAGRSR